MALAALGAYPVGIPRLVLPGYALFGGAFAIAVGARVNGHRAVGARMTGIPLIILDCGDIVAVITLPPAGKLAAPAAPFRGRPWHIFIGFPSWGASTRRPRSGSSAPSSIDRGRAFWRRARTRRWPIRGGRPPHPLLVMVTGVSFTTMVANAAGPMGGFTCWQCACPNILGTPPGISSSLNPSCALLLQPGLINANLLPIISASWRRWRLAPTGLRLIRHHQPTGFELLALVLTLVAGRVAALLVITAC